MAKCWNMRTPMTVADQSKSGKCIACLWSPQITWNKVNINLQLDAGIDGGWTIPPPCGPPNPMIWFPVPANTSINKINQQWTLLMAWEQAEE